ncbi:MAG: winged helix-turn-helix transcriptional regulator [Clostridia bacterium]|nr:winged helix-turn-helix transcriptional regulator [Clostridia bacterium]
MEEQYIKMAKVFKALSDPKRVKIIDMLSDGETCACVLLEHFQISQPTLSHDMKVLIEVGIVNSRREGQRVLYSLNMEKLLKMQQILRRMLQNDTEGEKRQEGEKGVSDRRAE